jgi:hypothetical protein
MSTAVFGAPEWFATSGRVVKVQENGGIVFDHVNGYITSEVVPDAEDFFEARKDDTLGRWRWPEHPEFVVYERAEGVLVLDETTGDNWFYRPGHVAHVGRALDAAIAYWQAHPVEPKPTAAEIVEQLRAWSDDPRPTRERLILGHAANTIEDLRRGRR